LCGRRKRAGGGIGEGGGVIGSGLAGGGISLNEDGAHAEGAGGFDIGEGIADEEAVGGAGLREIAKGLKEQAGAWLAAVALVFVVGAEIESVDVGAARAEMLLQGGVEGIDIGGGVAAEGDAALVADHDDAAAGTVESGDGGVDAGEDMEFFPAGDVVAFGRLAVDDAVAIEKDEVNSWEGSGHRWSDASMIADTVSTPAA
jgi:hypothetical protein